MESTGVLYLGRDRLPRVRRIEDLAPELIIGHGAFKSYRQE